MSNKAKLPMKGVTLRKILEMQFTSVKLLPPLTARERKVIAHARAMLTKQRR